MIYVDIESFWYYSRMLIELLFFYVILYFLWKENFSRKMIFYSLMLLPCTFFFQIFFEGFADILPIFTFYASFKHNYQNKFVLMNLLLISSIVPYVVSIIVSVLVINNPLLNEIPDAIYILLEVFLEFLVILVILYLLKLIAFKEVLYSYSSMFSTISLLFYYLSIQLFLYAADYFKVYEGFILGVALFLIIQLLFLGVFLIREIIAQKDKYDEISLRKQLDNFKIYSYQLEKNQQGLINFKHDYKNLIISLTNSIGEATSDSLKDCVEELKEYTETYLKKIDWECNDIGKIKNTYIKSLYLSKILLMKEQRIKLKFECKKEFNDVPIKVFDLIRILGISLDNAIEASKNTNSPEINLAIIKSNNQLEFVIQNSTIESNISIEKLMSPGVSTKKGHLGIGLSNIQEIKKKYENVYVHYEKNSKYFTVYIVIIMEGVK